MNAALRRLGLPPLKVGDLAATPAPRLKVIWSPQAYAVPELAANQPERYYPGDAYVDVVGDDPYDLGSVDWSAIERLYRAHPRKGFKEGIIEAFSAGMRDKPETTFGTMNTDVLEKTLPGYVRPNFCDYIRSSRFES